MNNYLLFFTFKYHHHRQDSPLFHFISRRHDAFSKVIKHLIFCTLSANISTLLVIFQSKDPSRIVCVRFGRLNTCMRDFYGTKMLYGISQKIEHSNIRIFSFIYNVYIEHLLKYVFIIPKISPVAAPIQKKYVVLNVNKEFLCRKCQIFFPSRMGGSAVMSNKRY